MPRFIREPQALAGQPSRGLASASESILCTVFDEGSVLERDWKCPGWCLSKVTLEQHDLYPQPAGDSHRTSTGKSQLSFLAMLGDPQPVGCSSAEDCVVMAGLPQAGSVSSPAQEVCERRPTINRQGSCPSVVLCPGRVGSSSGGISSSVSSTLQSQGLLLKRGET